MRNKRLYYFIGALVTMIYATLLLLLFIIYRIPNIEDMGLYLHFGLIIMDVINCLTEVFIFVKLRNNMKTYHNFEFKRVKKFLDLYEGFLVLNYLFAWILIGLRISMASDKSTQTCG